jgi:hypothetical protein
MVGTRDTKLPDPIALLRRLTSEQIRARMDELNAEQEALRVLLRSALARERTAQRKEAAHAS